MTFPPSPGNDSRSGRPRPGEAKVRRAGQAPVLPAASIVPATIARGPLIPLRAGTFDATAALRKVRGETDPQGCVFELPLEGFAPGTPEVVADLSNRRRSLAVVLDHAGSMAGSLGEETVIRVVRRETLTLPVTRTGCSEPAFGHEGSNGSSDSNDVAGRTRSCTALATVVPSGSQDAVRNAVAAALPCDRRPLADTITDAARPSHDASQPGVDTMGIISDGRETRGVDLVEAAKGAFIEARGDGGYDLPAGRLPKGRVELGAPPARPSDDPRRLTATASATIRVAMTAARQCLPPARPGMTRRNSPDAVAAGRAWRHAEAGTLREAAWLFDAGTRERTAGTRERTTGTRERAEARRAEIGSTPAPVAGKGEHVGH